MSEEPLRVSDEAHEHHCRLAGCYHPAVYKLEDGTTAQGWCARCRAAAFGGVLEGVEYGDA